MMIVWLDGWNSFFWVSFFLLVAWNCWFQERMLVENNSNIHATIDGRTGRTYNNDITTTTVTESS